MGLKHVGLIALVVAAVGLFVAGIFGAFNRDPVQSREGPVHPRVNDVATPPIERNVSELMTKVIGLLDRLQVQDQAAKVEYVQEVKGLREALKKTEIDAQKSAAETQEALNKAVSDLKAYVDKTKGDGKQGADKLKDLLEAAREEADIAPVPQPTSGLPPTPPPKLDPQAKALIGALAAGLAALFPELAPLLGPLLQALQLFTENKDVMEILPALAQVAAGLEVPAGALEKLVNASKGAAGKIPTVILDKLPAICGTQQLLNDLFREELEKRKAVAQQPDVIDFVAAVSLLPSPTREALKNEIVKHFAHPRFPSERARQVVFDLLLSKDKQAAAALVREWEVGR